MIVEDDANILNLLTDYLSDYNLIRVDNGPQALIEFDRHHIDLVILDVMLPILNGWEVCRNLRGRSSVPIIMLTAKTDEESSLKGFRLGVDNYVTKPFSPNVLVAKVKALLKRVDNKIAPEVEEYTIDPGFLINVPAHEVKVEHTDCHLSPTEFQILVLLVKNTGVAMSRNRIVDSIWGENYFGDPRIVDTNIKRLREKLGGKAHYVQTVRSYGYKFETKSP